MKIKKSNFTKQLSKSKKGFLFITMDQDSPQPKGLHSIALMLVSRDLTVIENQKRIFSEKEASGSVKALKIADEITNFLKEIGYDQDIVVFTTDPKECEAIKKRFGKLPNKPKIFGLMLNQMESPNLEIKSTHGFEKVYFSAIMKALGLNPDKHPEINNENMYKAVKAIKRNNISSAEDLLRVRKTISGAAAPPEKAKPQKQSSEKSAGLMQLQKNQDRLNECRRDLNLVMKAKKGKIFKDDPVALAKTIKHYKAAKVIEKIEKETDKKKINEMYKRAAIRIKKTISFLEDEAEKAKRKLKS